MRFTALNFILFYLVCFRTGFWFSVCRFLNSKHVFSARLLGGCISVSERELFGEFADVGWGCLCLRLSRSWDLWGRCTVLINWLFSLSPHCLRRCSSPSFCLSSSSSCSRPCLTPQYLNLSSFLHCFLYCKFSIVCCPL